MDVLKVGEDLFYAINAMVLMIMYFYSGTIFRNTKDLSTFFFNYVSLINYYYFIFFLNLSVYLFICTVHVQGLTSTIKVLSVIPHASPGSLHMGKASQPGWVCFSGNRIQYP